MTWRRVKYTFGSKKHRFYSIYAFNFSKEKLMWLQIKGGSYLGAASIQDNTAITGWP